MKMAELGQHVLVSCIIDFDDIQLWLRQFCLKLNICKVLTVFFKFWPKKIRKTVVTLQIFRFKQNCLSQSWISSKSIMQLTKTIFQNSAIFIEKKWVENRLWGKSGFLWGKRIYSLISSWVLVNLRLLSLIHLFRFLGFLDACLVCWTLDH